MIFPEYLSRREIAEISNGKEENRRNQPYVTCTVPIVALYKGLRQPDDDVPSHFVLEVLFHLSTMKIIP